MLGTTEFWCFIQQFAGSSIASSDWAYVSVEAPDNDVISDTFLIQKENKSKLIFTI